MFFVCSFLSFWLPPNLLLFAPLPSPPLEGDPKHHLSWGDTGEFNEMHGTINMLAESISPYFNDVSLRLRR